MDRELTNPTRVNPPEMVNVLPNIPYSQFRAPEIQAFPTPEISPPNGEIPIQPAITNEEMAARMERIENLLNNAVAEKVREVELISPEQVPYDTPDFFAGLDMDKVLDSPQNLKEILHRVYKSAVDVGTRRGVEIATANAVNLATQRSRVEATSQQALSRFYEKYPHLADKTNLVGLAIREVRDKNPELRDHNAIMTKVGEIFGAPATSPHKDVANTGVLGNRNMQTTNPGFVQPLGNQLRSTNAPPARDSNSQQAQIDELMASLFSR